MKDNILNILEDEVGGYKTSVTYWKKYHIDMYNEILQYAIDENINYYNFNSLLYLIINGTHLNKCRMCDNITKYNNFKNGYNKYCSKECKSNDVEAIKEKTELLKRNMLEKYGVDNISKLKHIKNKKEETMLKKYGVKYNSQRKEVKKILSDNIKSDTHQQNIKLGLIKSIGVDNPSKCEYIIEKKINTFNEKKIQRISEYGLKHDFTVNYMNDDEFDCNCKLCNKDFKIRYQLLHLRKDRNEIICTKCNILYGFSSKGEEEVYDFIKQYYDGEILLRNRKLGIELDIYLPELGIAFEFNGIYWHNELNKPMNYHLNKTEICNENNIQLIHIFQDDWIYKQDIVKSIILNKLNKSNKTYARKCVIKEVNNVNKKQFLIDNHIQGDCISKTNLGLYYNNELISLMTFGRRSISKNKTRHELLRFCNKLNTTVIGGASKLFKYFINNYEYNELYSYADYGRSNGNMYEKLGFTFFNKSKVNYWWVVDGIKSHRYNWNKQQLTKKKMLQINETENDCMHRHNYFKIYDCGTLIYKYTNP